MTQTESTRYRYMLSNQRRRNQSGDGMSDDIDTLRPPSAMLRRGSAPDLCNRLLPPIDDGKTNRSFSPKQSSHSPIANKVDRNTFERKSHIEGKLFSKHSTRLSIRSTSVSSDPNLSRNSSNPNASHTLVGQSDSTTTGRNYMSGSLTGVSPVPSDLLTTRHNGIPELQPLKLNSRLSRRRFSDTPDQRNEMHFRNVAERHSCEKVTSRNNNDTFVGLNRSNTETKITNHHVVNKKINTNTALKLRTLPTTKSDSHLTTATLRGINNSHFDSESNSTDGNDTRIIEWLIGVETSSAYQKDGTGSHDMPTEVDCENNDIQETAIRIVYEDTCS